MLLLLPVTRHCNQDSELGLFSEMWIHWPFLHCCYGRNALAPQVVLGTKAWRTAQSWTPCSRLATRHRPTGRRRTSASCLQSKQSRQSRVSAKGRKQSLLLARRESLATRLGKTPVSRFASPRIHHYIHTSTHPDIHHMSIHPDIHHMSIHPYTSLCPLILTLIFYLHALAIFRQYKDMDIWKR